MPRQLKDKFMNLTSWYYFLRFFITVEYFASLRSALHLTLVSNPIVSSRMYKILSAVSKRRSGRKESPVITLGDGNDGRSTNRVAPLIHCNEDATK